MSHIGNPRAVLSTGRVLSAKPQQVFAAIKDPSTLARWWGPKGFTNSFEQFDFRPSGQWRFTMHAPTGIDYPNESIFREVEQDRKIVIEHVVHPWYILTIQLQPQGDRTLLTWDQEFESAEVADRFRPISKTANEQNLDRLESVLREQVVRS